MITRRDTFLAAAALSATPGLVLAAPRKPVFERLGWAGKTPGGDGGKVIRVKTLEGGGPGSLREAIAAKGPRTIVFDVGGVIDLKRHSLKVVEPFLTIAGETAPSPGITLIRGSLAIESHDAIVRHIRVRAGRDGEAFKSGWEVDGITCWKAHDVIIDHCSVSWATDENLSASGPRFTGGEDPAKWRDGTSHRITLSNNIVAECLSNASHLKGEHSKGSLIHDNAYGVLIVGNLYAHNRERNQLFKGGVEAVTINNYIYNPGTRCMHYALNASEWVGHTWRKGQLAIAGNVVKGGVSTRPDLPFLIVEGQGDLELYAYDNPAFYADGTEMPPVRILNTDPFPKIKLLERAPFWPEGLKLKPSRQVAGHVLTNAGARPWDRDAVDKRIVREVKAGTGKVIDDEAEVGGYPKA